MITASSEQSLNCNSCITVRWHVNTGLLNLYFTSNADWETVIDKGNSILFSQDSASEVLAEALSGLHLLSSNKLFS